MASRRTAPAVVRAARTASDWVVFNCDGHRFGIPVDRVREIVPAMSTVRLPGCGAEVRGLANLRGRIITVIDLGAALALDAVAEAARHRVLLVEHGARRIGVAVQTVLGLATSEAPTVAAVDAAGRDDGEGHAALAVPAGVLNALGAAGDHVVGVGEWDDGPFVALDPDAILGRFFD